MLKLDNINKDSKNIKLEGYKGTWYVIGSEVIFGQRLYMMENEQLGEYESNVIVNNKGKVIMNDVEDGWEELEEKLSELEMIR